MDAARGPSRTVPMKVPFYDLDPMQIVWHGNYLKYFDVARAELFDGLGVDLFAVHDETGYLFPIVRSQVKHLRPLRRGDDFLCTATVREASAKIVVAFEIRLAADGTLCAKGTTEQVAVRMPGMELAFAIPEAVRRALGF